MARRLSKIFRRCDNGSAVLIHSTTSPSRRPLWIQVPRERPIYPSSVHLPHSPPTPVATPIALNQINHQPSPYMPCVPRLHPEIAGCTYSFIITPCVMRNAICTPTPMTTPSIEGRTIRTDTTTIPAFARHGGFMVLQGLRSRR